MFASSLLARFMHNPTRKHMGTAKRVLRYIQGTLDYGIEFIKGKTATLIGFVTVTGQEVKMIEEVLQDIHSH